MEIFQDVLSLVAMTTSCYPIIIFNLLTVRVKGTSLQFIVIIDGKKDGFIHSQNIKPKITLNTLRLQNNGYPWNTSILYYSSQRAYLDQIVHVNKLKSEALKNLFYFRNITKLSLEEM